MNPSLLSVHESHDFAYCKHYQYFILSSKYRLLHAYSHICPDIISRLYMCPEVSATGRYGSRDDVRADRADMGIGM
jgi:hypothetical protein